MLRPRDASIDCHPVQCLAWISMNFQRISFATGTVHSV